MVDLTNIIIAHRGVHNNKDIPENSMKAFKKALDKNLPMELDVHLTKDNVVVVFHDRIIKRMTGVNEDITQLTYEELSKYTLLKTKESIPKLTDVLDLVNGKELINIEVKYDDNYKACCKELVKILDDYDGEFLVQSFSWKIMNWFKKNRFTYTRGLLVSSKKNYIRLFSNSSLSNFLKVNFYSYSIHMYKNKRVCNLRKQNVPILFWTIPSKKHIKKYSKFQDGLICNNL